MKEKSNRHIKGSIRLNSRHEIIDPKNLDIKKFKANPILILNHKYWYSPIGKVLSVKKNGNKLDVQAEFTPFLKFDEIKHCSMDIGFIVKKSVDLTWWGRFKLFLKTMKWSSWKIKRIIEKAELLEISLIEKEEIKSN